MKGKRIGLFMDPPPGDQSHGVQAIHGRLAQQLEGMGHEVHVITCLEFGNVPKGVSQYDHVSRLIDDMQPDYIHVVTQGLLGLYTLRYCQFNGLSFTAGYHTLYPEWLRIRHGVPEWLGYSYIRFFGKRAKRIIVPTPSTRDKLTCWGLNNVSVCPYGIDLDRFQPGTPDSSFMPDLPRPYCLYVGRVTVEKGVPELCAIAHRLPGTLVIVGEGDSLMRELAAKYPHVRFMGKKMGDELVRFYQNATVFVFHSTSDTSGLVLTEALACGLPVAALPVIGPKDIVTDPQVGVLDSDLAVAAEKAMRLSPANCRRFVQERYSWERFANDWMGAQVPVGKRLVRSVASHWWHRHNPFMSMLVGLVDRTEKLLFAPEKQH